MTQGREFLLIRQSIGDHMPTPRPTNTRRPSIRTDAFGAAAMRIAPTKKRKSASRIAVRLPHLSLNHPPIAAPMIAPATAMLTMLSCLNQINEQLLLCLHLFYF
ncbi:hypothetical protein ACJIZ3_013383 [Penstemon smallii]|uniref:Uncharacterized protein n=1 Tax=Penstemon smallii TaxID=265156 RepID=A0ABD3UR62_9LAMI